MLVGLEAGPFWQRRTVGYDSERCLEVYSPGLRIDRLHFSHDELRWGLDGALGVEWPCLSWLSLHATYGVELSSMETESTFTSRIHYLESGDEGMDNSSSSDAHDEGWEFTARKVRFGISMFF